MAHGHTGVLSTLNEEQIGYFREFFGIFDHDGNENITARELGKALFAIGIMADENDLQEMINQVDFDGNGTIEFEEFVSILVRRMKDADCMDELRATFKVLDLDKNGFISVSELKSVMMKLGLKIGDDDAENLLRIADVDGDGDISFEDFAATMSNKF